LSQLLIRPSEYYNFLNLPRVRRISNRILFVYLYIDVYVLKITRFGYELLALYTEIKAYSILKRYRFRYTPKFLGYIYKEIKDQVIGFLIEALSSYYLNIKDLEIY
ncbi:hypothetical protein BGZ57DRAFT_779018, partial [Hyaloscypha finlandica]